MEYSRKFQDIKSKPEDVKRSLTALFRVMEYFRSKQFDERISKANPVRWGEVVWCAGGGREALPRCWRYTRGVH